MRPRTPHQARVLHEAQRTIDGTAAVQISTTPKGFSNVKARAEALSQVARHSRSAACGGLAAESYGPVLRLVVVAQSPHTYVLLGPDVECPVCRPTCRLSPSRLPAVVVAECGCRQKEGPGRVVNLA